jgi:hypothetical protein
MATKKVTKKENKCTPLNTAQKFALVSAAVAAGIYGLVDSGNAWGAWYNAPSQTQTDCKVKPKAKPATDNSMHVCNGCMAYAAGKPCNGCTDKKCDLKQAEQKTLEGTVSKEASKVAVVHEAKPAAPEKKLYENRGLEIKTQTGLDSNVEASKLEKLGMQYMDQHGKVSYFKGPFMLTPNDKRSEYGDVNVIAVLEDGTENLCQLTYKEFDALRDKYKNTYRGK